MKKWSQVGVISALIVSINVATIPTAQGFFGLGALAAGFVTKSAIYVEAAGAAGNVLNAFMPRGFREVVGVGVGLKLTGNWYLEFAEKALWTVAKYSGLGIAVYGSYAGIQYLTNNAVPSYQPNRTGYVGIGRITSITNGSMVGPSGAVYLGGANSDRHNYADRAKVQIPSLANPQDVYAGLKQKDALVAGAAAQASVFDGAVRMVGPNGLSGSPSISPDTQERVNQVINQLKRESEGNQPLSHFVFDAKNLNTGLQAVKYVAHQAGFEQVIVISALKLLNKQYDLDSSLTDLYNWAKAATPARKRLLVLTDYQNIAGNNLASKYSLPQDYLEGALIPTLVGQSASYTIIGISASSQARYDMLPSKPTEVLIEGGVSVGSGE